MRYLVIWEIEIFADSPKEAAEEARSIQLDPNSRARVFKVVPYNTQSTIDLDKELL